MTQILDAMQIIAARARLVSSGALNDDESVPSPCVAICQLDDAQTMCIGCLRTLDELRLWSVLDNAAKRAVWQHIEARLPPQPCPRTAPL